MTTHHHYPLSKTKQQVNEPDSRVTACSSSDETAMLAEMQESIELNLKAEREENETHNNDINIADTQIGKRKKERFILRKKHRKKHLPIQMGLVFTMAFFLSCFYTGGFGLLNRIKLELNIDANKSLSPFGSLMFFESSSSSSSSSPSLDLFPQQMPTHSPSLASRRSLEEETKCEGAKAANATAHGGEFPEDLFTAEEKKNGWVVLHIIGMIYMFVGLAVVCDDYFESSLQSISDALELSPDVAGATFMAAGSSAPELFTSLMGVFVATSDIGVGTIVGSAVFNVLIIIAMVCFAAPNVSLDWYPLTRDCIFYCLSIIALVATIFDQKVSWYESVVLFLLYFVYVYIMKRNSEIQEWMVRHANEPHVPTQLQTRVMKVCEHWTFNWFIYSVIIINITIVGLDLTDPQDWQKMVNHIFSGIFIAEMGVKIYGFGFFNYWREALNAFDGILVFMIVLELCLSGSGMAGGVRGLRLFRVFRALRGLRIVKLYRAFHRTYADDETQTDMQDLRLASFHGIKDLELDTFEPDTVPTNDANHENEKVDADDDEDEDEDEDGLWDVPESVGGKIYYFVSFLLRFCMYYTIPDCEKEGYEQYYVWTFTNSVVWIGIYSYVMVWMATVFGEVVGIPEPVMGLTLLAAGTSIPDALSSVAVAKRPKQGGGNAAVANSIGSNVFDILVGLGLPWVLKTCIFDIGSSVAIDSDALTLMVFTLFLTVALVVLAINFVGWRLTRRLGYLLLFTYGLFVAESLLLEYGVLLDLDDC